MIKTWLITTSAPICGTEQHYRAYAVENPYDSGKLDDWFWDTETEDLWSSYGWQWEDNFDEEFKEVRDDYDDNYDNFYTDKMQEWKESCNISCDECEEEDFQDYVPGGEGELDIIYDERNG